jgi:HlyD family secretion protein
MNNPPDAKLSGALETLDEVVRSVLAGAKPVEFRLASTDAERMQQAQTDLEHTYITAPVDGVVVARQVDVGQTVAASLQAPTLFVIAQDLTKMQVDTNVSEADIGRIQVGQPANFTVDAYPGITFHGQVASIRKAAINVQNVVTYNAVVTVSNPDLKLFPGMTANVNILIDKREGVLKVPNAALRFRPADERSPAAGKKGAGGKKVAPRPQAGQVVWVLDAGSKKPHAVSVVTGLSDGTYTEVSGGDLKQGDRVVTAAFSKKNETSAAAAPGAARGPRF